MTSEDAVGAQRTVFVCLAVVLITFAGNCVFLRLHSRELSFALSALLAVIVAGSGIAFARSGAPILAATLMARTQRLGWFTGIGTLGIVLCGLLWVARIVLDGFENSGDEYAYVLQAQTYAQGRLWVEAPPLPDAFKLAHFLAKDGIWVSRYPPGWAALMTPAIWLGLPLWTVCPVIGVALLAAFFLLARKKLSTPLACLATAAVAGSAFFILNSASYFSHAATALWGVLFAIFALHYLASGKAASALCAGAFLGLVGITRTFDAIIFLLPFTAALALTPNRKTGLLWVGLGGLPFFVALLAFNNAITGSPFTPIPSWFEDSGEPLGVPSIKSLSLTATHLARLVTFTSPLLPLGFILAFFTLARRKSLEFTDWIAPATVLAFAFYAGNGGNQYGPRYYFEAFPFAVLTIAKALNVGLSATVAARPTITAALLIHLAYQAGFLVPRLAFAHDVVIDRQDLYRQVEQQHLSNAVVLVASPSGVNRWMNPIDLVRNGLVIGNRPVIYAHDLGARNGEIRTLFPDRALYVYRNGTLALVR